VFAQKLNGVKLPKKKRKKIHATPFDGCWVSVAARLWAGRGPVVGHDDPDCSPEWVKKSAAALADPRGFLLQPA
jgi:hypothetical protein